jgi:hypothetical protein
MAEAGCTTDAAQTASIRVRRKSAGREKRAQAVSRWGIMGEPPRGSVRRHRLGDEYG